METAKNLGAMRKVPTTGSRALLRSSRPNSGNANNSSSSAAISTAAAASRTSLQSKANKRQLARRELLIVVTQLSIMLRSGVDLADAVHSISTRSKSESIRNAMSEVYAALEAGNSLSAALDHQRHQFGGVMVASVAAGEASGRLSEVLERLTQMINDELKLHSSIRSAVSYPLVLLSVTSLVMLAMVFFVLPQFGGIYKSSNAKTPLVTQLMLDGAELARGYWWLLLGLAITMAIAGWKWLQSSSGRACVDFWLLHLPILRSICGPLLSGRMFRLQGAMLSSGVSMIEVLELTKKSVSNRCFRDLVCQIEESVVAGEGMAAPLRSHSFIPDEAADMIATAEANGQLGNVLQTVGEFYESIGENKLRDAVKIAEPAIIVAMGLVIGAIVLSVMLPLLDLSSAAGK